MREAFQRRRLPPALAIGPANYAGQAYEWATAVDRFSSMHALAFSNRSLGAFHRGASLIDFPVHYTLPHHRLTTTIEKRVRMRRLLAGVTHLAVDGFLSVYGRQDRSHVGRELDTFERQGFEIALIAHGTDVRDPDLHLQRYGDESYYSRAPTEWVSSLRSSSRRNRLTSDDPRVKVFVSTPDLLLDVPRATWLPVCVNIGNWRTGQPALERSIPTVFHCPSRRSPPIKGTLQIDQVLRHLAKQGRITYVAPERLPRGAMRSLVLNADVVVDQIQSGSYGVAAVEAMAGGRLVVGYVGHDVRGLMKEPPPIIDAPPSHFADVMNEIVKQPDAFKPTACSGPEYVSRWHDGRVSAQVLCSFLGTFSSRSAAQ